MFIQRCAFTGVQNYNGQAVFDCIPAEGIIEPGM